MTWDYAELSKAAKAAGGPEKLVNQIAEQSKSLGYSEGQESMLPWIGTAIIGGALLATAIRQAYDYFKEKRAISQNALDEAKSELVEGIKQYDADHSEEQESDS